MRRLVVLELSVLFIVILTTPIMLSLNTTSIPHKDESSFIVSQEDYTQHEPIVINRNADFALQGFRGSGTYTNPYVIDGLFIEGGHNCISIYDTTLHFTIRNCVLTGCRNAAILLENVVNGLIIDCRMKGGDFGIILESCSSIDAFNSTIAGVVSSGIYVNDCNDDISISDNKIFRCETGIFLDRAESCLITMNRIYCNRFGLHLIEDTQLNVISQNSVGWNDNRDNRYNDGIDGANAVDDGYDNHWDGNRWSDYYSYSTYYEISGSRLSQDENPSQLLDVSAPTITVSDISNVVQGNSSAFLSWTIVDEFPLSYEMYQNGEIIDEGYLTKGIITQPLDALSYGEYNFTINIRDGVGHVEILQHIVTVIPGAYFMISLIICVGIIASVIVILPLDYLRRKKKKERIDQMEKEKEEELNFDLSELLK